MVNSKMTVVEIANMPECSLDLSHQTQQLSRMLNVLFTSKYQIFLSDLFSWDIVRSFTWTQRLDRQQSGDLQSQIGADFPILARLCSLASIHFNHRLLTRWSLMSDGVNTLPDVSPWGPDGDWPRVWMWLRLRWRHPLHHTATCQLTPATGTQATEDALVTRVKDSFHQNEKLLRSDTAKQSIQALCHKHAQKDKQNGLFHSFTKEGSRH